MTVQTRSMLKNLQGGSIGATPEPIEQPKKIVSRKGVILLSQIELDEIGINCDLDKLIPQYTRCLRISKSDFRREEDIFSPENNINSYEELENCGKEYALAPVGFYWRYVDPTSYYSDMGFWELAPLPKEKNEKRKYLPDFRKQPTCNHESLRFYMSRDSNTSKQHYERHHICCDCYYKHVETLKKETPRMAHFWAST